MPLTLLDIAKMNGSDQVVGLIEESEKGTPEVSGKVMFRGELVSVPNMGAARTISGTQYKTLVRTSVPTVAFRDANKGSASVKSTYENRLVQTFIMNPRWDCDKAVADAHEDGPEALIAMEADGILQGAFLTLARQFYYGRATFGDTKGHPGLVDSVDSSLIVDATGNTADTGSSVWAVKWGNKDVQWVFGKNGELAVSDVRVESVLDADDLPYTAYLQELFAYPGVQVGSKYSIGRIKNLTAQTGKGLTDALLGQLLAKFPAAKKPDCFFMSPRSLEQLRTSRTATNATGAEAPTPTEYEGIRLVPTDAIAITEAIG